MKQKAIPEERTSFKTRLDERYTAFRSKLRAKWYNFSSGLYRATHKKGPKKRSVTAKRRGEVLFYTLLMIFPIAQWLVFYVGVNFNSLLLSLKSYDYDAGQYYFIGFTHFQNFFTQLTNGSILTTGALNSLIIYLCSLAVGVPLSILFSFYLYKKLPMSGVFKVLLFLPSIISVIALAIMFKYFVEQGIPKVFEQLGMPIRGLLTNPGSTFVTVIFYSLWIGFGTSILMYTGAMTRIPDSLVEYGRLEGLSTFRELVSVTIPMIFPTITTFLVVGVAGYFTNQAHLFDFFGENAPYHAQTLGYYFFVQVAGQSATLAQYPYASAAGISFSVIAAPVVLTIRWALEKFGPTTEY